ncbi:hypothetical protein CLOSTASPAR_02605 [[Clostridium] asparagiforme DSM 15981]|uniref:Uncharacterized protein n=1 Tax=[Clostridium] asparagiforme DSM 15981 TaxID=518636 RepID=C0D024_9FIRM|nr:hypothetical protein CLOSTASPAR_02605 [[Clostridium] asparagiforme DSM 15981]
MPSAAGALILIQPPAASALFLKPYLTRGCPVPPYPAVLCEFAPKTRRSTENVLVFSPSSVLQ